jgi:putative ABC transport system permease protein
VLGATVTANVPRAALASIDPRAVVFALVLAAATTLLFALVPALQSSKLDVSSALREGGPRTAGGASHRRWRTGVVVAQAAFAALLAVGAVLMAKTLGSLTHIDVGFQPAGVLTQRLSLPQSAYPEAPDVVHFYQSLLDATRALPGVTSAGLLRSLPLGESIGDWGVTVEGYDAQGVGTSADWQVASDGASETLGERLVSGRFLARGDDENAADVAVINEAMVRKYWPGRDPVGQRFRIGGPQRPWVSVVGVVGDVRHNGITGIVKPKFYRPHAQFHRSRGGPTRDMALVVKTDGDPCAGSTPRCRSRACSRSRPSSPRRSWRRGSPRSCSGSSPCSRSCSARSASTGCSRWAWPSGARRSACGSRSARRRRPSAAWCCARA